MILLGALGRSSLAAEFGIVHGAMYALFFSFSANARNLILNRESEIELASLVHARLILLFPLGIASYVLSVGVPDIEVSGIIAVILIIRRGTEWLSELHLSRLEVQRSNKFANVFSFVQIMLFFTALFSVLLFQKFYWFGLLLWAIAPIFMHLNFIYRNFRNRWSIDRAYGFLLPQLGSTAIIGISVYVFRLLVLFFAGKNVAGELYAAYAVGGFISSIFVFALGPTLIFQNKKQYASDLPLWFKLVLLAFITMGGIISIFSVTGIINVLPFGSNLFWAAAGLSMIGGTFMILGQKIRIQLLQSIEKDYVIGPDIMINILIVAIIPFSYHLIGKGIFPYLFLFNAVLSFGIFTFVKFRNSPDLFQDPLAASFKKMLYLLAFFIVFPIFFQLSGQIFTNPSYLFDTKGLLMRVPIPFSIFACFGGLLYISNYKISKNTLYMLFFMFVLMTASTLITTQNQIGNQRDKFILMIQFFLPMFSILLGKMFEGENVTVINEKIFEKSALLVILIVVPIQIFNTRVSGIPILSPKMVFFSIYQHLQYVPTILICCYILVVFAFYENKPFYHIVLFISPLIGVYTALSNSMLTAFVLTSGLALICFVRYIQYNDKKPLVIFFCAVVSMVITMSYFINSVYMIEKWQFEKSVSAKSNPNAKSNIEYRIDIWRYYISGLLKNETNLFFGNSERPEREKYPSAHNYYLDLAYNFGVLSVMPILCMIAITLIKIYKMRFHLWQQQRLVGLIFIVLFLLFFDNSLKVGMRQPYPGIITFFLWGLLLSRIDACSKTHC
ncbi:MAG: hypothetical protein K9K88_00890 [Desulfobacterales bacterium]|nr:hypothetical protein [Desulfobacterales bacterium]